MPDVSLLEQLACARRELSLRLKVYPKWVAHEQMTEPVAQREIAAMTAIVHSLDHLVKAEERRREPRL